jgi:predicted metallopeptidase
MCVIELANIFATIQRAMVVFSRNAKSRASASIFTSFTTLIKTLQVKLYLLLDGSHGSHKVDTPTTI